MRLSTRLITGAAVSAVVILSSAPLFAQSKPTIQQWLAPGYPQFMVAAKKADKIAWQVYEEGSETSTSRPRPTSRRNGSRVSSPTMAPN